jgi:hypothetical protein
MYSVLSNSKTDFPISSLYPIDCLLRLIEQFIVLIEVFAGVECFLFGVAVWVELIVDQSRYFVFEVAGVCFFG